MFPSSFHPDSSLGAVQGILENYNEKVSLQLFLTQSLVPFRLSLISFNSVTHCLMGET